MLSQSVPKPLILQVQVLIKVCLSFKVVQQRVLNITLNFCFAGADDEPTSPDLLLDWMSSDSSSSDSEDEDSSIEVVATVNPVEMV